jgi:hypothetical protein
MSQSTIFMPCNVSGMFDPVVAGRYGIADFDWSNGKLTPDGRGWQQAKPMDTNAVLIGQAAQVKAVNPRTHVWVYRQLVKALPWYREVGEKMADPRYSGWFLPFRKGGASDLRNGSWHVPPCTGGLCSNLYHSQDQVQPNSCNGTCDCSGVPCGEYLWDMRNASLREWIVREHIMGEQGMANANVSGFYFDDDWLLSGQDWSEGPTGLPHRTANDVNLSSCATGPSELDSHCLLDTGLSAADVVALMAGWRTTTAAAMRAVYDAGGWVWQMFHHHNITAPLNSSECRAWLQMACTDESPQHTRMSYSGLSIKRHSPGWPTDPTGDVARFLLTRGPYAFLGTGWVGCVDGWFKLPTYNETYARPAALDIDYGTPVDGVCRESAPGVFTREWTKAIARHDCNTAKSTITMNDEGGSS